MKIPNIAKMRKTKKRTTVAQVRAELERLKTNYGTVLEQMKENNLGLRVELADLNIELDHARKLDRVLREYLDKLVFVSKNFRWIALSLIVVVMALVTNSIITGFMGGK